MSLSWIVTAETSFDLAACIEELNESLSEERDDPGEAKWIRDTVEESLNNLHMCSECQSKTVEGQLCVVLRNAKDEGVIKIIGCANCCGEDRLESVLATIQELCERSETELWWQPESDDEGDFGEVSPDEFFERMRQWRRQRFESN